MIGNALGLDRLQALIGLDRYAGHLGVCSDPIEQVDELASLLEPTHQRKQVVPVPLTSSPLVVELLGVTLVTDALELVSDCLEL